VRLPAHLGFEAGGTPHCDIDDFSARTSAHGLKPWLTPQVEPSRETRWAERWPCRISHHFHLRIADGRAGDAAHWSFKRSSDQSAGQ
jgi:hypothetical protein